LFVVVRSDYWPLSRDRTNGSGSPIGRDFLIFWTASVLSPLANALAFGAERGAIIAAMPLTTPYA
jgi:hypothetical protein